MSKPLKPGGRGLVEVLERRVGDVGADGERAARDELDPALGGAAAPAAAGGERESEDRAWPRGPTRGDSS